MKFVSQLIILFLLTILTGCQTQPSVSKTPSRPAQEADSLPVIEDAETASGFSSGTPNAMETPDITPAPSPFPTSNPPTPKITPVNLEELDSVPNQNEMDGFYVFTYPYNPYFQIELVDARTGDQRSLLPDGYASSSVSTSPDRQWLVFNEFPGTPGVNVRPETDKSTPLWQDSSLIFISSDGSELRIPYQAEWGPFHAG